MDFRYTEEQLMIRQAARDYAQRELIKDVIERDEKAGFPTQHVKNLAELGFLGMVNDLLQTADFPAGKSSIIDEFVRRFMK